ncbi:HAD family hydrolase [Oricola cellulosilytica]|uniref:HAD family hydrolase n=1 Tax=Oricola cellulosilytica TaxID=1429082 RepID=UPI001FCE63B6|nr:HAD family hydrolase [Oricola cellulosilytica]
MLATDLDGTFLGGNEKERAELYDWIEENRLSVGLIFVTGRDPEFIEDLCAGGVPWPEYVIGDVGTTIAEVSPDEGIKPIIELEREIADLWNGSGDRVRKTLRDHPGLSLQPTNFRYRVSYDLDMPEYDNRAGALIAELGLDHIISDSRFFDVLPQGISKGPSLKKLVAHLEIDERKVLAAGDTLNDLSMLACGLPAVAVGGAEQALLKEIADLDHVYKAEAIGAAGILEAVAALGMHSTPKG